jgi:hypothetical protein
MAIQGSLDLERELLESASVAPPGAIEKRIAWSPGIRPHQRSSTRSAVLL